MNGGYEAYAEAINLVVARSTNSHTYCMSK